MKKEKVDVIIRCEERVGPTRTIRTRWRGSTPTYTAANP